MAGSIVISLQTRIARAAAQEAERAWEHHRRQCWACDIAAARRRYADLCPEGAKARELAADLRAEAWREAELDKAQNPDQGTLFDLGGQP
jgi:hypothetical protein